jgi:cytochrome c biogenesis protein ResB
MSFESQVKVNSDKETVTISMNEPLKRDGYTLYQSSYQLIPNAPAVSIFSVNQDPGRWIKYLGSLILAIGIIIYTYMRSRLYRAKSQG